MRKFLKRALVCVIATSIAITSNPFGNLSSSVYAMTDPVTQTGGDSAERKAEAPIYGEAPTNGVNLNKTGWIASASLNSSDAQNAIDSDDSTYWSSNVRQTSGQWFQVDMGEARWVNAVTIDVTTPSTDFPRSFHVQVSQNGSLWEYVKISAYRDADNTSSATKMTLEFDAQSARYIRITQTAAYSDVSAGTFFNDDVIMKMNEFSVYGSEMNLPPVIEIQKDGIGQLIKTNKTVSINAKEGSICSFSVMTSDGNAGDELTLTTTGMPTGATFENGVFSWTPTSDQSGTHHYVTFVVSDNQGAEESVCVDITVGSDVPTIEDMATIEVVEGQQITYHVPGKNITSYSAVNLPEGAYINQESGVLRFAPNYTQAGTYHVVIVGTKGLSTVEKELVLAVTKADSTLPVVTKTYTTTFDQWWLRDKALADGGKISFTNDSVEEGTMIQVNPQVKYQGIEGVGNSLDGSSIYNIAHVSSTKQEELLNDLFNPVTGGNWNYMRICFGTSDFAADSFYTYQENPTDEFSIEKDVERGVIDTLKKVIQVNPEVKFLATVWSPPAWMKEANTTTGGTYSGKGADSLTHGGHIKSECLDDLADYYVKCVKAYEAEGIPIYAVTLHNEPDIYTEYPSTQFTGEDSKAFLKELYAAFKEADISAKIIGTDNNFHTASTFASPILSDATTYDMVDGNGFHDYGWEGSIDEMLKIKKQYPEKSVQITERSAYRDSGARRIIEYFRNGASAYDAWLTFLDVLGEPAIGPLFGTWPSQPVRSENGDVNNWYLTADYYFYTQFSKFIQPGAVVVDSTYGSRTQVTNLTVENPDGSMTMVVTNETDKSKSFTVVTPDGNFTDSLPAHTVSTYQWVPNKTDYGTVIDNADWEITAYNDENCDNIIDGNAWTRWANGEKQYPYQWIEIDLGQEQLVGGVSVSSGSSGTSGSITGIKGDYARAYKFEVSLDGRKWTSVASGTDTSDTLLCAFDQQKARYVRMKQMGEDTASYWSVNEFEIYSYLDKPIVTPVAEDTSTTIVQATGTVWKSDWSGKTKEDAVADIILDGDNTTYWTTGAQQATGSQYIEVNLQETKEIQSITLKSPEDSDDYGESYKIYYYKSGESTWAHSVTLENSTGNTMQYTFDTPIEAQYLNVQLATVRDSKYWTVSDIVLGYVTENETIVPEITIPDISEVSIHMGESVSIPISATVENSTEAAIISIVNKPYGANFENNTFTWTPNDSNNQLGEYIVTAAVTVGGTTEYKKFTIDVKRTQTQPGGVTVPITTTVEPTPVQSPDTTEEPKQILSDLKTKVTTQEDSSNKKLNEILKDKMVDQSELNYLSVHVTGSITDNNTMRVYAGSLSDAKPGSKVYVYTYNKTTNKLECLNRTTYSVDSEGYVTMDVERAAEYVFLDNKLSGENVLSRAAQTVVDTKVSLQDGKKDKIVVEIKDEFKKYAKVTYKSSDNSIVKVQKDGTIVGVSKGKSIVIVTVKIGDVTKKFKTTVTVK